MRRESKQSTCIGVGVVVVLVLVVYVYLQFLSTPENFPVDKNFTINERESLKSISYRLKDEGYITSPLLFRTGVSFLGKDRAIQLGGYTFETPLSLIGIVKVFIQPFFITGK